MYFIQTVRIDAYLTIVLSNRRIMVSELPTTIAVGNGPPPYATHRDDKLRVLVGLLCIEVRKIDFSEQQF